MSRTLCITANSAADVSDGSHRHREDECRAASKTIADITVDWYLPYIRPKATPQHVVAAARKTTVVFSAILVVIGSATAYAAIVLHSRVIPIVLGIFGYTYGSLLGVFLVGMLARQREGQSRGDGVRIHRCGGPERAAQ
jgi:hypothetical protein